MINVVGGEKHFTSSVWIKTREKPGKVLLVHHKKYGKWLQPGGHIKRQENPIQTAIREVREETGIDISFLSKEVKIVDRQGKFLPIPQYFMEQTIPSHKNEPEHFHLDIMYVVEVSEQKVKYNIKESHNVGWFTKEEALKLPLHGDSKIIIQELLKE